MWPEAVNLFRLAVTHAEPNCYEYLLICAEAILVCFKFPKTMFTLLVRAE